MLTLAVLVGVALTAWLMTLVGVSYALWRYAFQPWKALRADVLALNGKVDATIAQLAEIRSLLTPARIAAMSNEELASIERRLRRDASMRQEMSER
mgnify:CR=1 FL=1